MEALPAERLSIPAKFGATVTFVVSLSRVSCVAKWKGSRLCINCACQDLKEPMQTHQDQAWRFAKPNRTKENLPRPIQTEPLLSALKTGAFGLGGSSPSPSATSQTTSPIIAYGGAASPGYPMTHLTAAAFGVSRT